MAKKKVVRKAVPKAAKPAPKAAPKKAAKPHDTHDVSGRRNQQVSSAAAKATPVVKKSVPEQRISLQVYDVQDVPDHQHFYFVNGLKAKNVKELAELMDRIEQEVFDYHVNTEKNDFYNWVRHVFSDIELAEKLIGVTGPKHLQFTIYKHVADKALKGKK